MRKVALTLIWLQVALCMMAQNFNLSKYTMSDGLPQNYVYSVAQDPNGFMWMAMAEGLTRYDGINIVNYFTRDSLADNYVSRLLVDSDNRLWCGHGNGNLSVFEKNKFSRVFVQGVSAPIKDMCLDDKGNIWAVEQNQGLMRISPNKEVVTFFNNELMDQHIYYAVNAVNSLNILVGTSDGLMLVKFDADGDLKSVTQIEGTYDAVNCISKSYDGRSFWIGTDVGNVYKYTHGVGASQVSRCSESCASEEFPTYDIRDIYEDEGNNLYLATWGYGVRELRYSDERNQYVEVLQLNQDNGLGNNYISDITVDREGIFWFATYGSGVVAWINNYFAQYNTSDIGFQRNKVFSSAVDGNDLWLGMANGLIRMDVQCMTNFEYFDSSCGLPTNVAITSICIDKRRKIIYLGTENDGVYYRLSDSPRFYKLHYGAESLTCEMINGMQIDEHNLYLATQGGFIVYELSTGNPHLYTTLQGLPHNNINFTYIDKDGQVWLGPKDSGIALYTPEGESGMFEIYRLSDIPVNIAGMTFDKRGRMWLATVNNGIICNNEDGSMQSISTSDGLEKNYCYGIATDENGRIWVCHQPGLSCVDLGTGNIRVFNASNGISQEFSGVSTDNNGDLWFTANCGAMHYMSLYDKRNSVPPLINLIGVTISGKRHDISEPIDLPYPYDGNVAKFEFSFVGVCMKDPVNVRYEYWLEIGDAAMKDERWMPLGMQSHKEFDFLPDGDYKLHVRAVNSDGAISGRPLTIGIHIDNPFWKSTWFPISLLLMIAMLGRFITKMRERQLRQRQQELENEVARQTAELSSKNAIIERKNNDIMDSINYAKRIQTAILPAPTSLKDFPFKDSFLLFMPRDVVSGDFYWFNRYENHVIICCSDCTGHGVPGAFMSMIGTTILNDATRNPEMRHPAKLLDCLDHEIKHTLNKNQAIEAQDGMDCAIVDIDLDNLVMVSAAARRSIYTFTKGKINEIKGTRRSIGDRRNGNEFIETTTQFYHGDVFYLSSDGFTDQFGEKTGEKYTTGAFKRTLESIFEKPMEEQMDYLKEEFRRWKGCREQIDDILIMGIKF